jgi:hypothetical protein
MTEINSERERFEALAERYRSEAKVCRDFAPRRATLTRTRLRNKPKARR